ncbi:hypothetical protein AB0B45_05685 [Nonomuraea sp. NPDC049152]|uniref:hypothetical protein n=1 Tax=Nonomuraea sp. NPDC049152 TaxID=3154350 RepID=UPI0033C018BE
MTRAADRFIRVLLVIAVLVGISACSDTEVKGSFRPAFLPVSLDWGPGGLKVSGQTSLVTPVGVFSIGAEYALPDKEDDALYVIVRNADEVPQGQIDVGFDHIYKVRAGSGEFTAVVNGTTKIQVVDRTVLIDVTRGEVRTIQFQPAEVTIREHVPGPLERWDAYWSGAFYSPFALSRWAYDDSTMSEWFGLGFVLFLIRLVMAIVLGVADVVLLVCCLVAAVAYVLVGQTATNIVYGLEVLLGLLFALGLRGPALR